MKKTLITLATILIISSLCTPASAQQIINQPKYDKEAYHFGFLIGINTMQYALRMYDDFQQQWHDSNEWPGEIGGNSLYVYNITSASNPGFSVGIVGSLRMTDYFDLRFIPTLSFGERKMTYGFQLADNDPTFITKSMYSTFVEFPLMVKYKSKRYGNIAGYVICGGNYKIDLASQKANEIEIIVDGQTQTVINNIKVKRTDIAIDFGAGFDFYTAYFKFGIELKMSQGLTNILDPDNAIYSSSIEDLRNKVFQLSFTFE